MISQCCQSECYETPTEYICKSCGAKKQKDKIMIPTELEQRRKVITYMLESCVNHSEELTEWEFNFITSCSDQFDTKENLSDRQCEILEKIYDKI